MFDREVKWIEQKRREEEAAALALEEEEGLTVILDEETEPYSEIKMFKCLKLLIVYNSLQTVRIT